MKMLINCIHFWNLQIESFQNIGILILSHGKSFFTSLNFRKVCVCYYILLPCFLNHIARFNKIVPLSKENPLHIFLLTFALMFFDALTYLHALARVKKQGVFQMGLAVLTSILFRSSLYFTAVCIIVFFGSLVYRSTGGHFFGK